MSEFKLDNEHEYQIYVAGVYTTQIPRSYSVVPIFDDEIKYFKELSRKYNIAF